MSIQYANPDIPEFPLRGRRLPWWAWVLGILFPPEGLFMLLGVARLLSWPRAILLSIFSYATLVPFFIVLMNIDAGPSPSHILVATTLMAMETVMAGWLAAVYFIGKRARYWSRRVRNVWHILFWLYIAFLVVYLVEIAIELIARRA